MHVLSVEVEVVYISNTWSIEHNIISVISVEHILRIHVYPFLHISSRSSTGAEGKMDKIVNGIPIKSSQKCKIK